MELGLYFHANIIIYEFYDLPKFRSLTDSPNNEVLLQFMGIYQN